MSMVEREKQDERRHSAKAWADKDDSQYASKVVKFPAGITAIKLKTPMMNLDIIEYVCGPHNPECDEGLLHFELTYYVHRLPSPDGQDSYPCLWANRKQQCPICDWMREKSGQVDPELLKTMKPNLRHLMNAIDLGSKDQKIQILDVNHYNRGAGFGEQVKNAIRAVPQFADLARYDGGYTLVVTVADQFMGSKRKYQAATRIDFVSRQPYGEGILKHVVNLEDCLIQYEYEQLQSMFLQKGPGTARPAPVAPPQERGAPTGEYRREPPPTTPQQQPPTREVFRYEPPQQTQQPPARTYGLPPAPPPPAPPPPEEKKREPVASDYGMERGDQVEHPRFGVCEIIRISGDGTSLTIEDGNSVEYRAIGPAEVIKVTKRGNAPPTTAASPPQASPAQASPARETAPPPQAEPPSQRYRRDDDEFDRRPPARTVDPRRREQ